VNQAENNNVVFSLSERGGLLLIHRDILKRKDWPVFFFFSPEALSRIYFSVTGLSREKRGENGRNVSCSPCRKWE
jgi:hypothetical protein